MNATFCRSVGLERGRNMRSVPPETGAADAACTRNAEVGPPAVARLAPSGTVEMRIVQVACIGSANASTGGREFRGRRHAFTVSGASVGASGIEAWGEVYNLRELARFPGAYGEARYGFAHGTRSAGELWLQNEAGVVMRLKARREGLMLSLGGDAAVISMR